MTDTSTSLPPTDAGPTDDDAISLLDLVQVVVDNLRLLVVGPLVVGLSALGIAFVIAPTYTAKTQFLPPQQQQSAAASMLSSLGGLGGLAGAVGGLKNPADQYIAFMKSHAVQSALIERFDLKTRYSQDTVADARKSLSANVRTVSGKDGLISVEVDDHQPEFAAQLANAHIEELRQVLARLAVTEAQQRRMFFEKKWTKAKESLIEAETALKMTGISDSVLKSHPAVAVAGVAALKAQITAQEIKIGAMRGYLAETAPDFKQAQNELGNLRAQLLKQEKDQPMGSGQGDYVSRYREYKYQETLFELFAKQYELAKVDEAREGAVIQVLDVALPPEHKTKPKKGLIAVMATLATGFALLLFVFVRHSLAQAGQDERTALQLARIKASWRRALRLQSN